MGPSAPILEADAAAGRTAGTAKERAVQNHRLKWTQDGRRKQSVAV
ncbi:hypothetical protein GCM10010299_44140 [Streptomyces tanashiensis]|nr:hypothetical protein GCM10010299_44140 [Streptomyces tanashiensis]